MNPYDELLASSLTEIDDWCANSSNADRCPPQFYATLKSLIEDARSKRELQRNQPPFDVMLWMLTDSGPHDASFAPSLHRVIDSVTNRPSRHWDA